MFHLHLSLAIQDFHRLPDRSLKHYEDQALNPVGVGTAANQSELHPTAALLGTANRQQNRETSGIGDDLSSEPLPGETSQRGANV